MKRIVTCLFLIFIFCSCAKTPTKPPLTLAQFSKQAFQINEVVKKLMNEPNVKIMNFMADGVESTRAILCDSIGEECNTYYKFVNKVVSLTKDGELSVEDRKALSDIQKDLQIEIQKSQIKLQADWKNYLETQKKK